MCTDQNHHRRQYLIHSDRGSQYASNDFRQLLRTNGFRQSMSGKGNCYDNAQAKSFFSRFKTELIEGGAFEDIDQAQIEIFSDIEGYDNRVRLHSSLGYQSPMEFETKLKIKKWRKDREFFVYLNLTISRLIVRVNLRCAVLLTACGTN
jgi:putative transposase